MESLFLLSGDYPDMAKGEIFSLFGLKKAKSAGRLLIADLDAALLKNQLKRLALSKSVFRLLFECDVSDIGKSMKGFEWNSIYKDNFCIRVHYLDDIDNNPLKSTNKKIQKSKKSGGSPLASISEKNLAKYVWSSVNKPRVELENPKTSIELFIAKNKAYCGLMIHENREDFGPRKAHLRPFSHPSSLHPKLSRALVNLTGIRENESLLDPFCGTGGFLIEAGLMGIKVLGYDISKSMANGCKENLKYFKIKNYKIAVKNALSIDGKFDYVVTDLPYGLNSNVYLGYNQKTLKNKSNKISLKTGKNQIKNIGQFYLKFLKKLRKLLGKKAVIIFPSYVNYRNLLKQSKFKIEKEFSIYVHRSLSRKIVRIR
ncbi:methyltransferase domain-containing protein [Candidatus Woesearchaeota archaeon]|nr:methyltransferase domain-containing protein [Candidatus Woesearchaeota archaeon]